MRRDMWKRLARLEQRCRPAELPLFIMVTQSIGPERRDSLGPGERIVLDCYDQAGAQVYARERITTNPDDRGRHPAHFRRRTACDFILYLDGGEQEGAVHSDIALTQPEPRGHPDTA